MIEVVAGMLIAADERILLAQRPPGKHLAGMWEFPGGKIEAGEDAAGALARELAEELGIVVTASTLLGDVTWRYPEKVVRLHVRRIVSWSGEPRGREGQALHWIAWASVDVAMLAPADREILARLPVWLRVAGT